MGFLKISFSAAYRGQFSADESGTCAEHRHQMTAIS